MYRIAILSFIAVLTLSSLAHAADDRAAAAETLMNLFNVESSYETSMEQVMEMSLKMIDHQDLSAAEKIDAKKAVKASMEATLARFEWKTMKSMFVEIYAEVFTLEEIEGLITFYETPLGRTFIAKQPELTAATMHKMQGVMRDLLPKIQTEVQEALEGAREDTKKADPHAGHDH